MSWKLKRTTQCRKCPWRKDVNPRDIPNGYCETKHKALASTIARDPLSSLLDPTHVMACHETHNSHCIGWLVNQIGPGNNIGLRLQIRDCENVAQIRTVGPQHERFEDTLPQ